MTFLNITWQLDWFSEMFGIQQSRQVTEPRISFELRSQQWHFHYFKILIPFERERDHYMRAI